MVRELKMLLPELVLLEESKFIGKHYYEDIKSRFIAPVAYCTGYYEEEYNGSKGYYLHFLFEQKSFLVYTPRYPVLEKCLGVYKPKYRSKHQPNEAYFALMLVLMIVDQKSFTELITYNLFAEQVYRNNYKHLMEAVRGKQGFEQPEIQSCLFVN